MSRTNATVASNATSAGRMVPKTSSATPYRSGLKPRSAGYAPKSRWIAATTDSTSARADSGVAPGRRRPTTCQPCEPPPSGKSVTASRRNVQRKVDVRGTDAAELGGKPESGWKDPDDLPLPAVHFGGTPDDPRVPVPATHPRVVGDHDGVRRKAVRPQGLGTGEEASRLHVDTEDLDEVLAGPDRSDPLRVLGIGEVHVRLAPDREILEGAGPVQVGPILQRTTPTSSGSRSSDSRS